MPCLCYAFGGRLSRPPFDPELTVRAHSKKKAMTLLDKLLIFGVDSAYW